MWLSGTLPGHAQWGGAPEPVGTDTLWAWGSNLCGQLGDGLQVNRLAPVQVGADTGWASESAGGDSTVALRQSIAQVALFWSMR